MTDELPAGVEVVWLPCSICGTSTDLVCTDCAIDTAGVVLIHVCRRSDCRDQHEKDRHTEPPG